MALFDDFTTTRFTKEDDNKLIKKTATVTPTRKVKRGTGLLSKVNDIVLTVGSKLGKYEDKYVLLTTPESVKDYFTHIRDNGIAAIDTETSSLEPITTSLAGVCLYTPGQKAAYIPMNHVSYITNEILPDQVSADVVKEQLQQCTDVRWILHNSTFDMRVISNQIGVNISPYWDTMVAACLLNENESHRLKDLHLKYCDSQDTESLTFDALFSGVTSNVVPIKSFYLYAAGDAIKTYELYLFQKEHLTQEKLPGVYKVFTEIEMPMCTVISTMEDNGISLNLDYVNELSVKYNDLLKQQMNVTYTALSEYNDKIEDYKAHHPKHKLSTPINLGSPTQLAILLYDILGLVSPDKKKKRGTGEEIITKFDLPFLKELLRYRELSKLVSTYIDKMSNEVNPKTGKVHCRFRSMGAKTGRFSSESPNLQNIPSHNTDIRKMFVADPGCVLISSDYSKQELVILAAFCKDKNFIEALTSGKDVYSQIASMAFNKPYEECVEFNPDGTTNKAGKERRGQAKFITLGLNYGRGAKSIADQIGKDVNTAQDLIDSYYKGFPGIKKFQTQIVESAKTCGYVETLVGRKRRLTDLLLDEYEFTYTDVCFDPLDFTNNDVMEVDSKTIKKYTQQLVKSKKPDKVKIIEKASKEGIKIIDNTLKIADASRECLNAPIQGSAADMTKKAMILIHNNPELQKLCCKILLPVHDELIVQCPEENAKRVSELVPKLMVEAAAQIMDIPMKCDIEITHEWYGDPIELEEK